MKSEEYNICGGLDIHITAHCVSFNFSTRRERYDRILHPSGMVIVRLTIKEGTTQYSTDNTTLDLDIQSQESYLMNCLTDSKWEMTSRDSLVSNLNTYKCV